LVSLHRIPDFLEKIQDFLEEIHDFLDKFSSFLNQRIHCPGLFLSIIVIFKSIKKYKKKYKREIL
jgi:hypothetical protein